MSLFEEFKKFAMRGNVVDLAVGVVIGGAFGKIVSSLVGDLLMPVLGLLTGGIDFSRMAITLAPAAGGHAAVVLGYGKFLQSVLDFLIIALTIFLMLRLINRLTEKPQPPPAPPAPSAEEKLLAEIRDLLKARDGAGG